MTEAVRSALDYGLNDLNVIGIMINSNCVYFFFYWELLIWCTE